jgi:hypothetical protein
MSEKKQKLKKRLRVGGKLYERMKDGRYQNVDNPSDIISRRKAEKTYIQAEGYKSYEEKTKKRALAGIPKGAKRGYFKTNDQIYYEKKYDDLGSLLSGIVNIPENYIVIVRVNYTQRYEDEDTGKISGSIQRKGFITSYSRPTAILDRYDFIKKEDDMLERNQHINSYTLIITEPSQAQKVKRK